MAVAGPIEAARNRELEEKLGKESGLGGPNYIVFDRGLAGIGHGSNGVKAAINKVG